MPPCDEAADGQGRRGEFALLCLLHLVNDAYMSVIPVVLPFLLTAGRVGFGRGTVLAGAFFFTATVAQPFLGRAAAGRWGRRFFLASVGWAGLWLALLAAPLPFPASLAAAALAGLGVAAFHPLASSLAFRWAPARGRGGWMAVFLAAGNLGWSLPPLGLPRLLAERGLAGLAEAAAVPGVLASLALWSAFRRRAPGAVAGAGWAEPAGALPAVGPIVAVVALRSWANFGLVTALPVYLRGEGLGPAEAGRWVALFTAAGVAGGLIGGPLSDRWGRRRVTVASLALAAACFAAFLTRPEAGGPVWLALGGAALLASFPVTLVAAQEVLAGNPALAAGLLMGLAVGLGSLGVTAVGPLADACGQRAALWALAAAPLAVAGLACRMPGERPAALVRVAA